MCDRCFLLIYLSIKPLKNKKAKTVINDFNQTVNESNRKPNTKITIALCKNG